MFSAIVNSNKTIQIPLDSNQTWGDQLSALQSEIINELTRLIQEQGQQEKEEKEENS